MRAMSANSHIKEAVMHSRSPLPWALSWDANGELEIHDSYDLLQANAALEKDCALLISSEPGGSADWPPSCKFHGPFPAHHRL